MYRLPGGSVRRKPIGVRRIDAQFPPYEDVVIGKANRS
jgi:hypothetical protein